MKKIFLLLLAGLLSACCVGCDDQTKSDTGVKKATANVVTGVDGLTVEQRNVKNRIESDNAVGSIKHLYVISAYSGQTLIYSTVKGKVTSSGKRLTPLKVTTHTNRSGMLVNIGNEGWRTPEVIQDDGTYGSSIKYLYWWDAQGRYHQHYVSGGQILHISDKPLLVKSVIINMEQVKSKK